MIDYNKILKENSYGILATLDDSKPKTRIFQYLFSEKNKVYLATTNNKNVYKQLKKCPYVSFLSHSEDYLSFISVNGNIHFTDDIDFKTRVLNEYPAIKELFKTPDNSIFELFYIDAEEIRSFDLKTYTNENFKIEKP